MSKSIRQHLADLSGNSVRDYDFSRLAAHFGKAAKARDARDLRNEMNRERQVALSEPHIDMMRRAIEEAIEKESAELNGTLPVISMFEAAQIAKGAVKEASRDVGLQNLSTHLERRWKADKQAHLSASDIITLKDHYNRNFPKSAASRVVEGFTKSGWMDLPVGNLMDIASQIRSQKDFDYYIKEAGLHTNNPYNKKARNFILALLNERTAQEDDDLNPTIFLDNTGGQEEGFVTIHANEPGAGVWAKDVDGSIMGSNWEADGPDFAYAIIVDEPGLVEKLEAEGYNVDDSQYYEMDESEWAELAEKDEQRRFDEKQMKLPGIKSKKTAQEGDKPFQVGVTYEIWDDESLEIGDTDEQGWEVEKEPADLLDIANYVNKYGPFDHYSEYPPTSPGGWWRATDADEDFATGARTSYDIFVEYNDGSDLDQRDFELISKIVMGEMSWSEVDDLMDPDNPEPYQPSDPRQMKLPGIKSKKRAQKWLGPPEPAYLEDHYDSFDLFLESLTGDYPIVAWLEGPPDPEEIEGVLGILSDIGYIQVAQKVKELIPEDPDWIYGEVYDSPEMEALIKYGQSIQPMLEGMKEAYEDVFDRQSKYAQRLARSISKAVRG